MKHRRASAFLLAAIVGAAASLSDMPAALSQVITPSCEQTVSATALTGTALNAATPIKIGVTFSGTALVLSSTAPGKVISAPLDLAPMGMANTQMVITGARLRTTSAGNIRFFMSGSDSPEWVEAHRCDNIPTGLEFCVRFPKPAGRSLRWMALMDSTAGAPAIQSVQPIFDYLADNEHYQGGITIHEGIAYYGGFAEPGSLGQMYATSLDFATDHWRARERLASSTRRIFTANGNQLIPFEAGAAASLAPVLGRTEAEVPAIVDWVRNAQRFGRTGDPERRFGGIISSTPTVVGRPELPVWFFRASPTRRGQFLDFRRANFLRPPLVLYGAKDGMVHALHTDSQNLSDADMGKEAWAFIPTGVAANMASDFESNLISSYPDTWPVYDHVLIGGDFATIAVLAHGRGGTGISAIDVTSSVSGNAVGGFTVTGPVPLWEQIPQVLPGFEPGLALSRPAIARVAVNTTDERYMVIAGTGISYNDPDRIDENGRIVMAFDAETGNPYWKFQTRCPLTTAISVFETNDQGEPDPVPQLDGFMDRAVFADRCGYVYKVDLTAELAGGWNPGIGAIPTDVVDGVQMSALFQADDGRPVTGNIAVRAVVDGDTTRAALFFATGGLEEAPPFQQNTFYALAASPEVAGDTNTQELVFQRIQGLCPTPTNCEKFYGGVRFNAEQVIFSRVLEPPIGVGAAACDTQPGRTIIEARSLVGDISSAITQRLFELTVDSVMTTPFGSNGAGLIAFDRENNFRTVGNLGTGSAGAGGAGGPDEGTLGGGRAADDKRNAPMLILGWRQVY